MKLAKNILLNTDSYKVSMFKQYPAGTVGVYSYIESRGGRYDRTVMFGLQAFIKEYLLEPITQADIDIADEILTAHGEPFNREMDQRNVDGADEAQDRRGPRRLPQPHRHRSRAARPHLRRDAARSAQRPFRPLARARLAVPSNDRRRQRQRPARPARGSAR